MTRLFVPGFGARGAFYRSALGDGWMVHDGPSFRTGATFDDHVLSLARRLEVLPQPLTLAGHSLGAAVAVAVAARCPSRVAPRSALRLGRAVRKLDLRPQLAILRRLGVRCDVVSCAGDTLTPREHCREIAALAGASLREVTARGGHMWMVVEPSAFAQLAS